MAKARGISGGPLKLPPRNDDWGWYGQPAPRHLTVDGPKGRVLDARGRPVHRVIGFRREYSGDDSRDESSSWTKNSSSWTPPDEVNE